MDGNRDGQLSTYASMARSGIIEAVWVYGGGTISNEHLPGQLEYMIAPRVEGYLMDLKNHGVVGPYLVCVTMFGSKGRTFFDREDRFPNLVPLPHDPLMLPEVIIDYPDAPVEVALKPVFDTLWNCCGVSGSPYYDAATEKLKQQRK